MNEEQSKLANTTLSKSFIFKGAKESSLNSIMEQASVLSLKKKECLFVEGDASDKVYILISGRMQFLMHDENGKRCVLGLIADYGIFGDMEVFTKGVRVSHAEAHEECQVIEMEAELFVDLVKNDSAIAFNIVRFYASLLERLSRFSLFRNIEKQLAYILIDLASRYGKSVRIDLDTARPIDGIEIDLSISQEFLGSLVGVPRQRINTTLKSWEAKSWIRVNYSRVTILDMRSLEKFSVI